MAGTKGRFAPTPSGCMHAGNALCYLLAWLSARSQGGTVVLRVEDTDVTRMSPSATEQTFSDLAWLGLDWDEGPSPEERTGPYFQSCRTKIYDQYFSLLRERGAVYPCFCSRRDVRLAAAPHEEDRAAIYPGTCRNLPPEEAAEKAKKRAPAWRLRLEDETVSFSDVLRGDFSCEILREYGDFPIRRADGVYCYQFTAALDDALMGVSEVVRSRDLLSSTPWQVYLQRLFGFAPPRFIHIPLLLDEDGKRMAKRDFSLSVRQIRRHYAPEEVVGALAFLAGLQEDSTPRTAEELIPLFDWEKLPREDIVTPRALFARCAADGEEAER
ncbi:MAG: tRNA glutamyl-Q(34) synthetase GluQRS [Oscillospiraceae bacterium]|nr:tRNA glutamyl-Q(34) synthetase GluQRS [Oscillospiraceae bacterium]